ncbi:protein of unknown function [Butyrivibrio sp. INlla18]|uniref:DUF4869 domain-containing protein n=1 Tax=Butyrivibrio sp. INlla18 TaxID=1520806 RepID=UPI0008854D8F|nr:DUF4869 domain-containing protein [Butyrivibrio sp. INlla18]SDA41889.1 protein of unknown function [Butyrivibrio sp. INlla18]
MLSIYFGNYKKAYYGPAWFNNSYDSEWFENQLVQKMIKDIDKSDYKGGELIVSEVLGPIAPKDLSGGLKTLISIYKNPQMIFDATSCGNNCAKWLLEIGEKEDVLIKLEYLMEFEGLEPFEIKIDNTGEIVTTEKAYVVAALKALHEGVDNEG